jgi:hypothetical protein
MTKAIKEEYNRDVVKWLDHAILKQNIAMLFVSTPNPASCSLKAVTLAVSCRPSLTKHQEIGKIVANDKS